MVALMVGRSHSIDESIDLINDCNLFPFQTKLN